MPALAASKARVLERLNGTHAGRWIVAWTCLGLLGSAAVVLTGGQLAGGAVRWWVDPTIITSDSDQEIVLYAGMVALTLAWLALGLQARASVMKPRTLWIIGALWALPLVLTAPVFSRDVYSYFAQGTLLNHGLNPYHDLPTALARIHQDRVLSAVDPFWQQTTAPYGPLFLGIVSLFAGVAGSHVVLGAQLVKLLGLVGLALLAVFVPRLARTQGYDPTRATWLAVLNPLVLFALVVPGHNDLLMVGLMVAGVTLATEGRPLVGICVCALAATIKLPAAVAALFIAVAWARSASDWQDRVRRLAQAAVVGLAIFGLVSLITGVGVSWVTSTLFSAPARVKLAITPASGLAWTISHVVGVSFTTLQSVLRGLFGALTLLLVLELLRRTSRTKLVWCLGLALVVLAWGGPAAWPWYFVWGLALLAATAGTRTLVWSVLLIVAGAFVVKPSGILALPLESAPYVMSAYALVAVLGFFTWRSYSASTETPPGLTQTRHTPTDGSPSGPRESALVKP
ncbi:MAG: polyprenol phosphomannose-dependent alpha 1,6 mannosyltransferase MptB [Solirubrobacteraceae bacterium]